MRRFSEGLEIPEKNADLDDGEIRVLWARCREIVGKAVNSCVFSSLFIVLNLLFMGLCILWDP